MRNESVTRKEIIDPLILSAGWAIDDPTQVRMEIPVDGYDATPWNGVTDYCLYRKNGEVIAVVEAKRTSRDPRVAEQQVRHYVNEIAKRQTFRPFSFLTNGYQTYFWDVGASAKREIAGLFSLDDLENRLYIRNASLDVSTMPINTSIASRAYQHEAIRRITELFANGGTRALVVMATGTGKTRTIMALFDLLIRSNHARRLLFVADRDTLVRQALNDNIKVFLPDEPNHRIRTYDTSTTQRVFVATLQTISLCYRKYNPGFFDVIVFDEAHRSLFNQYRDALEYFDAKLIGLTATPIDLIDRSTFQVFHCFDGSPTSLYSFEQAIAEKHLVNYSLYQARTKFQRHGIRGAFLSEEERELLLDQGIDPDSLNYEGTELERTVSNRDTIRKQWEEILDICYKDASGQLPGKTIVFALSQAHALRLSAVFDEMYPQYNDVLSVITSNMERTDDLVDRFKYESKPRIAVSVDLLDTGLDLPEIVNLVFMKPVHSGVKLMQMLGRGTRNEESCKHLEWLPEKSKKDFLVLDFWQNDFDRSAIEEVKSQGLPVLVKLFNNQLRLLEWYRSAEDAPQVASVVADLRKQILQIPTDAFSVRKLLSRVEIAWDDAFWFALTNTKLEFLKTEIAPLMRFVSNVDIAAATFTNKMERLAYEICEQSPNSLTVESIREDVSRLPGFVLEDSRGLAAARLALSASITTASRDILKGVTETLAPQMKNRKAGLSSFIELDLADSVAVSGYISVGDGAEQVYVTVYRQRVEAEIVRLAESHPTLISIRNGASVSDDDIVALERTLAATIGGSPVHGTRANLAKAFNIKVSSFLGFVRTILEMDALPDYETVVRRQFDAFIAAHVYTADQINFLRVVERLLAERHSISVADLYEAPFTSFGRNAIERLFKDSDIAQLLELASRVAA